MHPRDHTVRSKLDDRKHQREWTKHADSRRAGAHEREREGEDDRGGIDLTQGRILGDREAEGEDRHGDRAGEAGAMIRGTRAQPPPPPDDSESSEDERSVPPPRAIEAEHGSERAESEREAERIVACRTHRSRLIRLGDRLVGIIGDQGDPERERREIGAVLCCGTETRTDECLRARLLFSPRRFGDRFGDRGVPALRRAFFRFFGNRRLGRGKRGRG